MVIVSRVGKHSYIIRVTPEKEMGAHQSFLKPYNEDTCNKDPMPLFFHRRTIVDAKALPDEYEVEEILDHRITRGGKEEYLTWWKGWPKENASWEPPNHFFHRYSSDFVKYCKRKGLHQGLMKFLRDTPHEEE